MIAVESMGVAQPEHGVHKRPGKDNRAEREKQMSSEMAAQIGFVDSDQKTHGEERSASGHDDEDKNKKPAWVLFSRARPQFLNRRGKDCHPCEQELAKSECIPGRDRFGRRMNTTVQRKKHGRSNPKSDNEVMAGILSRNHGEKSRHGDGS
jgi:hypothetical protein